MAILLANNASSLLAVPALAADLTMTITTGDAVMFPAPSGGDSFSVTLEDRREVPNKREIVKVTAVSGDVFTIVRAQEGTAATDFYVGATVSLRLTAGTVRGLIGEETTRAEAAETAEAAARAAAVTAEATARAAGDAAEAAARASAITTEQLARSAADTAETAARTAADSAEVIARNAAIASAISGVSSSIGSSITSAVAVETARAEAAEATLTSDLAAEVSRATAAEAALSARIATSTSVYAGTDITDGAGSCTVTFSTAFPTNIDSVVACAWSATATWMNIITASPTGFTTKAFSPLAGGGWAVPGCHFFWIAVGH